MTIDTDQLFTPTKAALPGSRGYTLSEMAIVMIIFGLMLAAAAVIATGIYTKAKIVGTQGKLDNIAKALDYYAVQHNRVPCPAVPQTGTNNPAFGYEQGSDVNGTILNNSCGGTSANWVGIVPFKTLGISKDLVIDAWGNYITYAISPGFAQDPSQDLPVHSRCRTADWYAPGIIYESGSGGTNQFIHKNPAKARFCCSGTSRGNDLQILDINNSSQIVANTATAASYASTSIPYADPANPTAYLAANSQSTIADTDRATGPVYVLVSHGANGWGALNVSTGTPTGTVHATPDEGKNALFPTSTFYEIAKIDRLNGEKNFDDVVLWRTQDVIFAEQGQSCSVP